MSKSPKIKTIRCLAARGAGTVRTRADLIVDGRDFSLEGHEDGFFSAGVCSTRSTAEMSLYRKEIFGPGLMVVRAADYE